MPVAPDDPRVARCGFAKLLGPDVEVYMRKYEITIGRRSKSTALDVVLGDNMNISRLHAKIRYNFQTGRFELEVLGKNGVTVKGSLHTPGSVPVVLQSQDLIQIGESSFHFLLPKDLSKLKSTGKRPRSSGATSGHVNRPPSATAVSEEDAYSEEYDPNYQSDAYDDKAYAHAPNPHDQYAEEYQGGEEEYEEDVDAGGEGAAAPHMAGEVYDEDEDEEPYDEQYNGGQQYAAPPRHANHYGH